MRVRNSPSCLKRKASKEVGHEHEHRDDEDEGRKEKRRWHGAGSLQVSAHPAEHFVPDAPLVTRPSGEQDRGLVGADDTAPELNPDGNVIAFGGLPHGA